MDTGNLLGRFSGQLAALVAGAADGVVQVRGRHARPATGTSIGDDRILVAAHAVDADGDIAVRASGVKAAGRLLGFDPATGLAVVQVPGLTGSLSSGPPARVGEIVIALGRTWSGALAASTGIVSVIGGPLRTGRGTSIEEVLRADVRVHPLGAGGPLLDVEGRVVGLATGGAIRGTPLFIPAAIAWAVAQTITSHGTIKRGYLGIGAQPVRLPSAQRGAGQQDTGLVVVGIAPQSPADAAGVLVGDVVMGFDGTAVQVHDDLLALLTPDRVGKTCRLDVIRGTERRGLDVVVGEH
jgi:S1-C subfamily serine protease